MMKITTDFSLTSRPARIGSGVSLMSLFAQGETGALLSAGSSAMFSDLDGQIPATFGQSLARINDLSLNARHARQPAAALRPLLGRAPADAPQGGAIDQGSGPAFIRFDLADDVLTTVFPSGGSFDVLVFGRKGSWIMRDVEIAPEGTLDIGPTSLTGAIIGLLPALGDIVGWAAIDRPLSEGEVARLLSYHKARGAKGFLIPGPELNRDPEFNDPEKWQAAGGWSVSDGSASITDATGAWPLRDISVSAHIGSFYIATIEIEFVSGGALSIFENGNGTITQFPTQPGAHSVISPVNPGADRLVLRAGGNLNTTINSYSLRELRPEEDW